MIWLLAAPIVFVMALKEFWEDSYRGFFDHFMAAVMAGIFSVLFGLFPAAGIAALIGLAFDTHPAQVSDDRLVALRDKDGMNGQFFLGTGTIEGDQYFFYYRELSDGGFQAGKVKASSGVRVYEEQREDARIVAFRWELNQDWAWWVSFPVNTGGYSYVFHVPVGTIRRGYSM